MFMIKIHHTKISETSNYNFNGSLRMYLITQFTDFLKKLNIELLNGRTILLIWCFHFSPLSIY